MNRFLSLTVVVALSYPANVRPQEWKVLDLGTNIYAIAEKGRYLWFGGGGGGLRKLDTITGEMVSYTEANSGLPDNYVTSIAFGSEGEMWIGTAGGGLAEFDGKRWKVYNAVNSGLPRDEVRSLAVDHRGNLWVGTYLGGLARFDGESWLVYNKTNSGLPDDRVYSIVIDDWGNVWTGTNRGLARFDGKEWKFYTQLHHNGSGKPEKLPQN